MMEYNIDLNAIHRLGKLIFTVSVLVSFPSRWWS